MRPKSFNHRGHRDTKKNKPSVSSVPLWLKSLYCDIGTVTTTVFVAVWPPPSVQVMVMV
jgi:hypothetical protein